MKQSISEKNLSSGSGKDGKGTGAKSS